MSSRKEANNGTLLSTAKVARAGDRSVKTIEEWIRDNVLPPTDFVNGNFAVFDQEYIELITPAMQEGRAAVVARVAELRVERPDLWHMNGSEE